MPSTPNLPAYFMTRCVYRVIGVWSRLMDSAGKRVKEAGAAEPVRIVGMKGETKGLACLPPRTLLFCGLWLWSALPTASMRKEIIDKFQVQHQQQRAHAVWCCAATCDIFFRLSFCLSACLPCTCFGRVWHSSGVCCARFRAIRWL